MNFSNQLGTPYCSIGARTAVTALLLLSPLISVYAQGPSLRIDIDGVSSRTTSDFISLEARPGASITSQEVRVSLFGFANGNQRDRGVSSDLLTDFAFNDGPNAAVGLLIEDLPAGRYNVQSWHYDGAGYAGRIQVEFRPRNGASTTLVNRFDIQNQAPAAYVIESDGSTDYELVFREDSDNDRARLNGISITPDIDPIRLDIDSNTQRTDQRFQAFDVNASSSVINQGVKFTLFGHRGSDTRDRQDSSDLLTDFVFTGSTNAGVGLRMESLPSGRYEVQSWHYDGDGYPGRIQIEYRRRNGPATILLDRLDMQSREPARFLIESNGNDTYELVFREDDEHNRARLNGISLVRLGPAGARNGEEGFEVIADDGVWTWFNDERAIFHKGILYSGYVKSTGEYGITRYDPGVGSRQEMIISTSRSEQRDDHNNPSLTVLRDGRILAVYAKHNILNEYYTRTSLNDSPRSSADWGPEQVIPVPGRATYANTYRLTEEGDRLYNFYRSISFNPTVDISDDEGQTWSSPAQLVGTGSGGVRPYPKYISNDRDRIDFIYTDGHPHDEENSIYHLFYRDNAFRRTNGSAVRSFSRLPILHDDGERGTVVYPYTEGRWSAGQGADDYIPGGRGWTWDMASLSNGDPVAVFQVSSDRPGDFSNDRIFYYYARWTGSSWQRRMIAHGGRPLYRGQRAYGGGITIDPDRPNVVYISTNARNPFNLSNIDNVPLAGGDRYEIWKGVSTDFGNSFQWSPVTSNSHEDNLRPHVSKDHGFRDHVIWFRGRYSSFTSYDTRVVGIFEN